MSETLPAEPIDRLEEISAQSVYYATVRQLPFLTDEQQATYAEAARNGDTEAAYQLFTNCLNWTIDKAYYLYQAHQPAHTDLMDLIGHANIKMLEALPNALKSTDPVKYLMSVGAYEMHTYCIRRDPMIRRPKVEPKHYEHPMTVSNTTTWARVEELRGPDVLLTPEEEPTDDTLYEAIDRLPEKQRYLIMGYYGLGAFAAHKADELAVQFGTTKKGIESSLRRAHERLGRLL